MNFLNCKRWKR